MYGDAIYISNRDRYFVYDYINFKILSVDHNMLEIHNIVLNVKGS
jgi:hypothetical protein